ncbi:MAG TPA: RcnB family protein [Acetobacteraceae bacterium]|nr:RcnB family protein [Acetobacteraceae bacterium]
MKINRTLLMALAALLALGTGAQSQPQPTDKRPPGMNKPVGTPRPPGNGWDGKPKPPPARPNPPPRPTPPRPGPSRPKPPPRPARPPVKPAPGRPGRPGHRPPPFAGHLPRHRYRIGAYRRPPGYYFRQWDRGQVLPPLFRAQTYWLSGFAAYGLAPPPPGAVWIRVDSDALLVSTSTGQILDIVYNIFY